MSDITIGNLVVQMSANVARLSSDMAQAKSVVTKATDEISKAAESAMHALEAIGIGLSIHEFAELVRGSMEAAEHLLNLQKATGIAVEGLAGLSLLAKQNGTDIDSLAKAIEKLSVNMGKAPEDFVALGISAKDPMEAFKQLADIFNLIPDIQNRNAVAMKALGKTWAEIVPVMSLGSEEIGKTVDKGIALSHMTTDLAVQSKAFNDKWVELVGTGGFMNQMTTALLPVLNGLADDLLAVKESSSGSTTAFQTMGEAVGSGVAITKEAVIWLYNHKTAVEAVAGAYASWKIATWLGPLVTEMAKSTVATYEKVVADMAAKASTVALAEANVAATAASVALTAARVAELRAAVLANEGTIALEITTNGLIPAEARLTAATLAHAEAVAGLAVVQREASVTAAATSGAISMLGGPLGVLITLLGIAATAWAVFGQKSGSAFDSANDAIARGMAIVKQFQKEAQFGVGQTGDLEAALDAVNKKIELLSQSHSPGAAKLLEEARAQADQLQSALYKTTTAQTGLTDEQKKAAAAAAEFLKTNDATKEGYAALANRINQYNAELTQQASQDTKVTEGEKLAIAAKLLYGAAITQNTQAAIDWMLAKEKSNKLTHDEAREDAAAQKRYADAIDAQEKSTQSVVEATAKMREHNAEMGKTGDELAVIRQATLDASIASDQRALSILTENAIESEATRALQAHITALQDQKKAMAETADSQMMLDLQKDQISLWKTIDSTAQQVFTSIFTKGQSAFDKLKNALKDGLIALLYQMTVKQWIFNIVAAVSGTSVATQAIGASVVSGAAGSAVGGSLFGSTAGASIFSALPSLGTAVTNLSTIVPTFTTMFSSGATLMESASAAFAGTAASFATVVPYVGAAILAIKAISGLFGSGGGPKVGGSATLQDGTASVWSALGMQTEHQADTQFGDSLKTFAAGLEATIAKLGGSVDKHLAYSIGLSADPAGTAPDAVFARLADSLGNVIYQHSNAEVARGGGSVEIGVELQRMMVAALKASDIGAWAKEILNSIDPTSASTEAMTAAMTALDSAMKQINDADAARTKLLSSLLTPTEQLAAAHAALATAGIPETVAGFKAMANSLDLTTVAGQNTLLQMVNLKGAFDRVQPAAENAATAVAVQAEIDKLTLSSGELLTRQRKAEIDAADATTAALLVTRNALQDLKQAAMDAAEATKTVVGFDAAGLGQMMLAAAFNPEAGRTAAESFGIALQNSVRNALISSTVGSISQSIYDAIVIPMVAGAAVTDATMDSVIADAQAKLTTMATVLNELDLSKLIATVTNLLPSINVYTPPPDTSAADAQRAAAAAATVLNSKLSLQAQIYALTGDAVSAATVLEQQHAIALAELNKQDPSGELARLTTALWDLQSATQSVATAKEALTTAYNNESMALKNTISTMAAFATSIRSFKDGLLLGNLSPLTPLEKYTEAKSQYDKTLADAKSSDPLIAAAAQSKIQEAASAFLTASQLVNASGDAYKADFNTVAKDMTTTASWAETQATVATDSLAQLKLQVSGLININTSVVSVKDAVDALVLSMGKMSPEYQARQLFANNPTVTQYLPSGPDAQAISYWANEITAKGLAAVRTIFSGLVADYAAAHPLNGSHAAGLSIVPFDGYRAELHQGEQVLTAPEAINYKTMGRLDMAPLVTEIKALREEVKMLRAEQGAQTGAIISGNYDANDRAADKVAAGAVKAAKESVWATRSAAKIL